jgi:hypothetical protein
MRKIHTNPFIKTPMQVELGKSIRDYKIWFHMLDYGDPVDDGFHAITKLSKVLLPAIKNKEERTKLSEGIRIYKEATDYNAWRKSYTKAVNDAMDVVLKRFPLLPRAVCHAAITEALEAA